MVFYGPVIDSGESTESSQRKPTVEIATIDSGEATESSQWKPTVETAVINSREATKSSQQKSSASNSNRVTETKSTANAEAAMESTKYPGYLYFSMFEHTGFQQQKLAKRKSFSHFIFFLFIGIPTYLIIRVRNAFAGDTKRQQSTHEMASIIQLHLLNSK